MLKLHLIHSFIIIYLSITPLKNFLKCAFYLLISNVWLDPKLLNEFDELKCSELNLPSLDSLDGSRSSNWACVINTSPSGLSALSNGCSLHPWPTRKERESGAGVGLNLKYDL